MRNLNLMTGSKAIKCMLTQYIALIHDATQIIRDRVIYFHFAAICAICG